MKLRAHPLFEKDVKKLEQEGQSEAFGCIKEDKRESHEI
jgi:hypothetical protein